MIEGRRPESILAHRRHEADAIPSVLLTRLAKIGAEANNGTYTIWLTELHDGHPDLFLILLLSFCPRLQVLIPGLGLHSAQYLWHELAPNTLLSQLCISHALPCWAKH
jgi:hypothetical protein